MNITSRFITVHTLIIVTFFSLLGQSNLIAQLTTLEFADACSKLEHNYPSLHNEAVSQAIYNEKSKNLDAAKLPQLSIKADAKWQSESVELNTEGLPFPIDFDIPNYNVKIYGQINYNIHDGGRIAAQRILDNLALQIDHQELEQIRYHIQSQILTLFSGITTLRLQKELFNNALSDISTRIERMTAGVEEGVILESERDKLIVHRLELKSQQDNIQYHIIGLIQTLAYLLNEDLDQNITLIYPELPESISESKRPELAYFDLKRQAIMARSSQINSTKRPSINAFGQFGTGHPNPVNFLDNETAPFAILGVQFSWNLIDWKQTKYQNQILTLQSEKVQNEERTFLFNLNSKDAKYQAEIERLSSQIELNRSIAELQNKILHQLQAQLDEGIITSSEYIIQVNAELSSKQKLLINEADLLHTKLNHLNEKGLL
jgi:outer membrane protein TolC